MKRCTRVCKMFTIVFDYVIEWFIEDAIIKENRKFYTRFSILHAMFIVHAEYACCASSLFLFFHIPISVMPTIYSCTDLLLNNVIGSLC